jgi:hypothetical protein
LEYAEREGPMHWPSVNEDIRKNAAFRRAS